MGRERLLKHQASTIVVLETGMHTVESFLFFLRLRATIDSMLNFLHCEGEGEGFGHAMCLLA
jgi:hypothetical protein